MQTFLHTLQSVMPCLWGVCCIFANPEGGSDFRRAIPYTMRKHAWPKKRGQLGFKVLGLGVHLAKLCQVHSQPKDPEPQAQMQSGCAVLPKDY